MTFSVTSKYRHFFLCSLLQAYPVRSLLRHLQVSQRISYPVARSSNRLTIPMCALWCNLYLNSLHRTVFAGKSIGCTIVRWDLVDFRSLLLVYDQTGSVFLVSSVWSSLLLHLRFFWCQEGQSLLANTSPLHLLVLGIQRYSDTLGLVLGPVGLHVLI